MKLHIDNPYNIRMYTPINSGVQMGEDGSWNGKKLYCYMCGHFWTVRSDKPPKTCPRCRSSRYDTPIKREHKCTYCGHVWMLESISDKCPECGHVFSMMSDSRVCHCNQCDHEWIPRTDKTPERCPKCDSHDWNGEKLHQFMCKRCGFVWRNKVDNPKKCPNCFSTKWNETTFKLQCKRCGHKWMSTNPDGSEGVKVCPACKSPKWNETLKTAKCSNCGTIYIYQKKGDQCPNCYERRSGKAVKRYHCEFCHAEWTSLSRNSPICPTCGIPLNMSPTFALEGSVTLWVGESMKLTYTDLYDYGCIYLWQGDYPVASIGLESFLKGARLNVTDFSLRILSVQYETFWRDVADYLSEHRDEYRENIPYFKQRLGLSDLDAEILALHFMGFCPEVIAIRLQKPLKEIRVVFDHIMKAYSDNKIVVNDSIFTEDPISLYDSADKYL